MSNIQKYIVNLLVIANPRFWPLFARFWPDNASKCLKIEPKMTPFCRSCTVSSGDHFPSMNISLVQAKKRRYS